LFSSELLNYDILNRMKLLHICSTSLLSIGIILSGGLFFLATHKWIDFSALEQYNPGKPSIVLDDEDQEWTRFEIDKRAPIQLKQVPPHLINAFLAAEDHHFFDHGGISIKGSIRSALVNITHGRIVQGASTITQQLVKLLFFNAQRTFKRKIKEQIFALLVEQQFTKEQILETYLNHIYLGCGIYGIEAAAQRFWGKHACDVTIDEAAILAGIVRSPENYCPFNNPQATIKRRNTVLNSMKNLNMIPVDIYTTLRTQPLPPLLPKQICCAPYVREMIRQGLEEKYGKDMLYYGGMIIKTTINQKMQETANNLYTRHLKKIREQCAPRAEAALVTIDTKTGALKALIGGSSFTAKPFNRATQARRQMGSTFKPLIYALALMQGIAFSDTDIDEPISVVYDNKPWEPLNANKRFRGQMTLAAALARSNNIIAVKTLLKVGIDPIIDYAKKAHITGALNPYPSLALGCIDTTVLEVSAFFNIFANNGIYAKPHWIEWIKDSWGKKIERTSVQTEEILPWKICSQVAQVLTKKFGKCDAIGKTGTTNDARSCWFVGATPNYTTTIYLGNDDNTAMPNVFSSYTAMPLWFAFNKAIPQPITHFFYEPTLHKKTIDPITGNPVPPYTPAALTILE